MTAYKTMDEAAAMKAPINLRVEQDPYPHLRDDRGCILARDFQNTDKLDFILEAVREKVEREGAKK